MSRRVLLIDNGGFEPAAWALPPFSDANRIHCEVEFRVVGETSCHPLLRVGFIGLDRVGRSMALKLLNAGYRLTVYDPDRDSAQVLEYAGARVAHSIAEACSGADVVLTMLADEATVEAVVLGPDGVVESMPRNAIHIGSSNVSVECSDRLVEAHWEASQRYISAPRLGSPDLEEERELFMVVGGWERTIEEVRPLLDAVGEMTAVLDGWPSAANLVQLTQVLCARKIP